MKLHLEDPDCKRSKQHLLSIGGASDEESRAANMSGQYKDAMPKVLNDAGDMLGVILALCSHMIVFCDESAIEGQLRGPAGHFWPAVSIQPSMRTL